MTTTAQATGKIIQNGIGLSHLGKIWRILLMIVPAVSEIIRPPGQFLGNHFDPNDEQCSYYRYRSSYLRL
jgi:hypothetical protein